MSDREYTISLEYIGSMDSRLHLRLLEWWTDNPSDPDRPSLDNPDVQRLVAAIEPESRATDLGGVMSLNARLEPAELVLRVHQPFVSRQRLLAVQQARHALTDQGLVVPVALSWRGATVFRCGRRLAEMERYIVHERSATDEHRPYLPPAGRMDGHRGGA